jgi:hypothetical protein
VRWLPGNVLQSTVTGSFARRFDAGQAATNEGELAVTYAAVNLVGRPFPGVEIGGEFLHGTNQTADRAHGEANRIQVSATAYLP